MVARVVVAKARVVVAQVSAGVGGVCTWPSELQSIFMKRYESCVACLGSGLGSGSGLGVGLGSLHEEVRVGYESCVALSSPQSRLNSATNCVGPRPELRGFASPKMSLAPARGSNA